MFAWLVGNVDANSAFVLACMFAAVGVPTAIMVAKRRSRRELELQFEVDSQKLANEDKANERQNQRQLEHDLAQISTEKDIQFERIHSGLIEGKKN